MGADNETRTGWTFLTNHAHVLLCVAENPGARVRDIAQRCEITERSASYILSDLVREGYLSKERVGRRNIYKLGDGSLRHPMNKGVLVSRLLDAVLGPHEDAS